jgi:phosphohistidine phosphatase
MKQLFVIRHAKSSWAMSGQPDFDRPLNDRGLRDAPHMAKRLSEAGIQLDAILSSPANRAITTAAFFAECFGISFEAIVQLPQLYHAPPEVFYQVIALHIPDTAHSVAIFAHNPGITEFVNTTRTRLIVDMPTCAIVGITAEVEKWADWQASKKRHLLFDFPKNEGL